MCYHNISLQIDNSKNIYLVTYVVIGPNASLVALNAKFICKGHKSIAEDMTILTGYYVEVEANLSHQLMRLINHLFLTQDVWSV